MCLNCVKEMKGFTYALIFRNSRHNWISVMDPEKNLNFRVNYPEDKSKKLIRSTKAENERLTSKVMPLKSNYIHLAINCNFWHE